jgi:hypothetical protein
LTTKPTETHSFPNKHKKTKRKSKIADTIGWPKQAPSVDFWRGGGDELLQLHSLLKLP